MFVGSFSCGEWQRSLQELHYIWMSDLFCVVYVSLCSFALCCVCFFVLCYVLVACHLLVVAKCQTLPLIVSVSEQWYSATLHSLNYICDAYSYCRSSISYALTLPSNLEVSSILDLHCYLFHLMWHVNCVCLCCMNDYC